MRDRRDQAWRTWLAVSVPVVALVAVVAIGVLGGSSGPAPSAKPSLSVLVSQEPRASATPTTAPTPTLAVAAPCDDVQRPFDADAPIDLTGTWAGDDGGIYYVRQRDDVIWWSGMSARNGPLVALGRDWNNVGRGVVQRDLTIVAEWMDVPRGGADGYGTVDFQIGADPQGSIIITKTSETGTGRGDSVWTPCEPG